MRTTYIIVAVFALIIIAGGIYWFFVAHPTVPTNTQVVTKSEEVPSTQNQPMTQPSQTTMRNTDSTYIASTFVTKTADANGKSVSYEIGSFATPFTLDSVPSTDRSTASPVQALALYYGLLASGDISGAAKAVSTNPDATIAMLTKWRTRIGEEEFKKQFTSSPIVTDIIKTSDASIVLVKAKMSDGSEYTGANVFIPGTDGYRLVQDTSTLSADTQAVLSAVLTERNR